ncbi:hypothetical protein MUP38_06080 [Candidatus Bathyarchaeota archaeon]|nr:hypothetical protein [Candidatus Bathyarchaeota archaeon]
MSICPKCGAKVANPVKSWPASFAQVKSVEDKPQFFIGLFECPACRTKFRARVGPKEELPAIANVKNEVERIKGVREELMQSLKSLREKIQVLETEKKSLMGEVEGLRKAAESRVTTLEGEVSQMREEAKSLKELLGNNDGKETASPSQKPSST